MLRAEGSACSIMVPSHKGSIHLFRFAGVNVYLHWTWLVAGYVLFVFRMHLPHGYTDRFWSFNELLALFLIVLLHEFGHSLACRSVGGRADQIILWPLGGVAFVDPPPRPGATLWSIAAGPLVNVMLFPIFTMGLLVATAVHWDRTSPNLYNYILAVWGMNVGLLCFNLLPVYPLDGGQILRSLLWFPLGRAKSLLVASSIGLVAVAVWLVASVIKQETWLTIMGVFVLLNCWAGLQHARALGRMAAAPRRAGLACPRCGAAPPVGNYWRCGRCRVLFDTFGNRGICPNCGTIYNVTSCPDCGQSSPFNAFGEVRP
jgi:Zn-dependent protease